MSGLYIIYKCLNLFYYFISDIVIYLIYIDLMRKRCQLINVDVDVKKWLPGKRQCYEQKSATSKCFTEFGDCKLNASNAISVQG